MSRPRKANPEGLPPCVYRRHGAYYLVRKGVWERLGADRAEALAEYGRLTSPGPRDGGMPALLERVYTLHCRDKSAQTAIAYASAKRRLAAVFRDFEPQQIQPRHVAALRQADAAKPNAANRNQTFLRVAMNYALEWGLVDSNPCVGARRLREGKRDRYITDDELQRIRAAAPPRLAVIIDLCYLTGQRIGDVLRIRFADIQPDGLHVTQTKTGAKLRIALGPDLADALARARALLSDGRVALMPTGYLLRQQMPGHRHQPPAYSVVLAQWRAACQRAGVENANLHDIRAKAATDSQRQGLNPTALLGHTSKQQTDTYLRDRQAPLVAGPSFGQ